MGGPAGDGGAWAQLIAALVEAIHPSDPRDRRRLRPSLPWLIVGLGVVWFGLLGPLTSGGPPPDWVIAVIAVALVVIPILMIALTFVWIVRRVSGNEPRASAGTVSASSRNHRGRPTGRLRSRRRQ